MDAQQPSQSQSPDGQPAVKKGKRKPHRKSRTGCRQCRASRVKCDELKPSCSYCIRHSETCSFLTTEPTTTGSLTVGPGLHTRTASPLSRFNPSKSGSPISDSGLCSNLHMKDMELVINYTTSTAATLAQTADTYHVWSTEIPRVALEYPFLMHGLLAISSLHLAYLRPQKKQEYSLLSAHHENIGLPLFRSAAAKVTPENCAALFAFSAMVVVYAVASPSQPSQSLFSEGFSADGLPEWLHLLRGLGGLMRPAHNWIVNTPLAPMLKRDTENMHIRALHPADELHLSALSSLFIFPADASLERLEELTVYRETLTILRDSFMNPTSPELTLRPMPYVFFAFVSETYIRYLSERRPEALVLMAYECVLLKRLEPCWFIDGLAFRLMETIIENLGREWRFWIEWPLQEVGVH